MQIFFAVSRKHATKLVTLLNEEATRRWPQAYAAGSTFAVQVTSDIEGAQQMTIDYAHNNLNGKSKWRAETFPDADADAIAERVAARLQSRLIEPNAVYSVKTAARLVELSEQGLRRFLRAGVIRGSRKLGDWRVTGAELLKLAG